MKAFLLYRDRDLDIDSELPPGTEDLVQDLGLETVLNVMADDDPFLLEVARHGLLALLDDPADIAHRQQVLDDCLREREIVRELYALTVETLQEQRRHWRPVIDHASATLAGAIDDMELFVGMLAKLRDATTEYDGRFRSPGFRRLFAMLREELDDAYFSTVADHLKQLKLTKGVLVSARLGAGNKAVDYVLRKPLKRGWRERLPGGRETYSFRIADRDENGARALADLRDRGITLAAAALAAAASHVLAFFTMLRRELGFYVSCLNLDERLAERGYAHCRPQARPREVPMLSARGLYDVGLALRSPEPVVGNDLDAADASLVVITGANQGGKSTFLRSVGLAQLMLQAGMFAPADAFAADLRTSVFTHFKREEDESMRSGKFDEELKRMSEIADALRDGGLVLFNESFASTNEREGSEIASQIVTALREQGMKVVFVTHMYELARQLFEQPDRHAVFLRAGRRDDGARTYKLQPGRPLPTSHGEDLYERIFTDEPRPHARLAH